MAFTIEALKSAVALHLSPNVAARLDELCAECGEVDTGAISAAAASDLITVAMTGLPIDAASTSLQAMTLHQVIVLKDGERVTFSPADIEYAPFSCWVEPTFAVGVRDPLWAGVEYAAGRRAEGLPRWGIIETVFHEGRLLGAFISVTLDDGGLVLVYGQDLPRYRLVERKAFVGDALFLIGQALQASLNGEAGDAQPMTDEAARRAEAHAAAAETVVH